MSLFLNQIKFLIFIFLFFSIYANAETNGGLGIQVSKYNEYVHINYVYKNSKGVIFTSLFGPDAIPPLEAWNYKKPLIYNDRLEDDATKGTAILIDVKSPSAISTLQRRVHGASFTGGSNRLIEAS